MRRTLSAAALAAFVTLANVAVAMAAGPSASATPGGGGSGGGQHDPSQIGAHAKNIVSANAKAFWWILLVVGLLSMAASRRAGRAIATAVVLVISGIAIYNPAGVGSMMSNLAGQIV